MKETKIAAYVIVVLLLAANLYMSIHMQNRMDQIQTDVHPQKSLPCESVPLSWAVTNYGCANSLLAAMNVSNVKFKLPGNRYNRSVLTSKS